MKANSNIIYMKKNEEGIYVIDENSKRSLRQDLLERFDETSCLGEKIKNVFDYSSCSDEIPENFADILLNKNIRNVTPK